MARIYFAHLKTTYGTALEDRAITVINKRWPDYQVVNPSSPSISAAAVNLLPICGMDLFDLIASKCNLLIAMPYEDGVFGAGVYSEICAANSAGSELYRIDPVSLDITPLVFFDVQGLSVTETRQRAKTTK